MRFLLGVCILYHGTDTNFSGCFFLNWVSQTPRIVSSLDHRSFFLFYLTYCSFLASCLSSRCRSKDNQQFSFRSGNPFQFKVDAYVDALMH